MLSTNRNIRFRGFWIINTYDKFSQGLDISINCVIFYKKMSFQLCRQRRHDELGRNQAWNPELVKVHAWECELAFQKFLDCWEKNMVIRISDGEHTDYETLMEREWLETNGRGGYASSTVLNCHSRKYHGLMVANLDSPGGRFVLLSKFEDSVQLQDGEFFLSIHKYPMVYYPHNEHSLSQFTLDLYPRFTYRIRNIVIEKELMLVHGEDTLLVRYSIREAPYPVYLMVKPLIAYRDIHDLAHENAFLRQQTHDVPNGFSILPYDGMPDLYMQTNKKSLFCPEPGWHRRFEYLKERKRGFSYQEDLFMPGTFECRMSSGSEIIFRVSLHADRRRIATLWKKEAERRKELHTTIQVNDKNTEDFKTRLHISAQDFVIRNRRKKLSIIAGYHWFYEWGRDALISLPGLTFYTKRIKEGIEILKNIAELRKGGLIPNNISEESEQRAYNSVDASLWYFWCIQELLKHTGDYELIMNDFWPVLADISAHYFFGTPGHIRVLENGLLSVGNASTQLTWMDAKVYGIPVTPRYGCPVEINALWFNALCFIQKLARKFGRELPFDADSFTDKIKRSFESCFWIPGKHYLADTWMPDEGIMDESIRPNQLLALSLPFCVITDHEKACGIMRTVSEELLTPYGLRTLSPADSRYRGKYSGSPEERDAAYHQGTVWPWLLGHYGEALLKTENNSETAREKLRAIIANMERHMFDAGLGHISEIFSGDPPYEPCGCIAQAWSTAEIIRLQTLLEH